MARSDWMAAGDEILRLVQDAVETGDFSQLGNTISNVAADALDSVSDAVRGRSGSTGYTQSGYEQEAYGANSYGTHTYGAGTYRTNTYGAYQKKETKQKVARKLPGEAVGAVLQMLGFSAGVMFAICLALFGMASLRFPFVMWRTWSILGLCTAGCFALGFYGRGKSNLVKRYLRYEELLEGKTFCKLEDLSRQTHRPLALVQKDLRFMVPGGFFEEAYLDRKETVLITDQSTYQQYLEAEAAYEERKQAQEMAAYEERRRAQASQEVEAPQKKSASAVSENTATAARTPEHQALLDEGHRYIRHIRDCNDRIPGVEVTDKLNRLELVVTRIFEEAEKDPQMVSDLRKMMSYYLPTTSKLLDAYIELDAQPVRGENVETSKREIEHALDTINTAFETLLDSLFQEKAWDISSDISVLNTMFAQEGLTKDGGIKM